MPDNLLLDTCALVWLAKGDRQLSSAARNAINRAPQVYVSAISAWEVGLKSVRGALELPSSPETWFADVVEHHDLVLADLTVSILMAANRLPWHHRDPADRFILATAQEHRLPIVTTDARFEVYGITIIA